MLKLKQWGSNTNRLKWNLTLEQSVSVGWLHTSDLTRGRGCKGNRGIKKDQVQSSSFSR